MKNLMNEAFYKAVTSEIGYSAHELGNVCCVLKCTRDVDTLAQLFANITAYEDDNGCVEFSLESDVLRIFLNRKSPHTGIQEWRLAYRDYYLNVVKLDIPTELCED